MAAKLDSRHHAFMQAMLNRGPLSEKATMAMFKSLMRSNSGDGFVPFLGAINKELEFVQMEVKKVLNQYDGKEFYGIINTLPSNEAKLGTKYSQAQILFFTAVVEAIVQEPTASGFISSTGALYLKLDTQGGSQSQAASTQASAAPVKMTMQAKEETLALLVSDQLLCRTADGGVALGVKSFLELRSVFRNLEVPFCAVCNEAAIKAQLCSTKDCSMRVHSYCVSRRLHAQKQRFKCSACGADWKHPAEVEEQASGEDDKVIPIATQEPVRKSGKRSKNRIKRRVAVANHEDEEHFEANEQDDENDTPNVSFPAKHRSKRSAAIVDDEDE